MEPCRHQLSAQSFGLAGRLLILPAGKERAVQISDCGAPPVFPAFPGDCGEQKIYGGTK